MKTHHTLRSGLALVALAVMSMPAFAICPTLPDGPQSDNVTNTQERALCLQQELQNNTADRNRQVHFDNLKSNVQQEQIRRRFDNLPTVVRPNSWDR